MGDQATIDQPSLQTLADAASRKAARHGTVTKRASVEHQQRGRGVVEGSQPIGVALAQGAQAQGVRSSVIRACDFLDDAPGGWIEQAMGNRLANDRFTQPGAGLSASLATGAPARLKT